LTRLRLKVTPDILAPRTEGRAKVSKSLSRTW
jgi:hypothetical protein